MPPAAEGDMGACPLPLLKDISISVAADALDPRGVPLRPRKVSPPLPPDEEKTESEALLLRGLRCEGRASMIRSNG